ncbi:HIT domain-containing protein [Nocardia fusca]|uniref:HIT domain-containing protein n=1 Tax=Nocardia fusca TaxID=941183 RepID=UPI0037C5F972
MLHHVQVACPPGGEESMRAFYHGVLGWAEIPKPPLLAARGGCWFVVPGVDGPAAELHIGPEDPFRPARRAHPAFVVDVDAVAAGLVAAGYAVRWADAAEIPGRRRFHTDDPAGNRLEFLGADDGAGARRVPFDIADYERRVRESPCFICAIVAGTHDSELEQIIDEDDENIAFLCRYPTLTGHTLVAPKQHHEHVVRDLELEQFRRLTEMVHRVARAVETVVPTERMYLASLGSQQGNSHLHWHIAPLPPGVPYREQQFHALMAENGVLAWTLADAVDLAGRLRRALNS